MSRHDFNIPLSYRHRVVFTRGAFHGSNRELAKLLDEGGGRRALVLVEDKVAAAWPELVESARGYINGIPVDLAGVHLLAGGEKAKADDHRLREIWELIMAAHLDRHSYLLVIGGGALLDVAGLAAATAHRGVRLVRFPTTTLAQDDSGVGVKCAINHFGKKNWIGSFAVPFAVINDFNFLHSQPEETRRGGLIEAVKVALVKDRGFFEWIERNTEALAALETDALETCVERSAMLHARHIAEGGDPFESGSSRPLDFGHWAAHKLESLTNYLLPHDRAVAVGLALDTLYSARAGIAPDSLVGRVFPVMRGLRFPIHHPALEQRDADGRHELLAGLDEFREHLGGRLTLLMLCEVGRGLDVHDVDHRVMEQCIDELRTTAAAWTPQSPGRIIP
jgi:3-dehydroquinate synthase